MVKLSNCDSNVSQSWSSVFRDLLDYIISGATREIDSQIKDDALTSEGACNAVMVLNPYTFPRPVGQHQSLVRPFGFIVVS